MKLPSWILPQRISFLDGMLIGAFVVFLVVPAQIPAFVAQWIDSPIGIAIIALVAFYLFFTTTPILGVLSLIVAYELLRRSAKSAGRYASNTFLYGNSDASIPTESTRTMQMQALNAATVHGSDSLEQDIINRNVPIGHMPTAMRYNKPIDTKFRPVLDSDHGESTI